MDSVIIAIFGGMAAFVILLFVGGYQWDSYSCSSRAQQMGVPSTYSMATDCMVQYNGKWLPLRSIRGLADD